MASMSRGLHTIDKFMDAAIVSAKFHDQIYFSKMENSVWKFPNSFLNVLKFHKARFVSTYRENGKHSPAGHEAIHSCCPQAFLSPPIPFALS